MWIPTFFKGNLHSFKYPRNLISLCDLQLSVLRNSKILKKRKRKKKKKPDVTLGWKCVNDFIWQI